MNNQDQIKYDVKNCNTGQYIRTAELEKISECMRIEHQKKWLESVNKKIGGVRW